MSDVASLTERRERSKRSEDDKISRFQVFLGCISDDSDVVLRLMVKAPPGDYSIGVYADDHSKIVSITPDTDLSGDKSTTLTIVLREQVNYHVIDFLPDTNTVHCTLYFAPMKEGAAWKRQLLHTGCYIFQ